MSRVGVMQGRLSPRPPDRLQAFPLDWRRELGTAAELGFEFLEWLLLPMADGPNPLDAVDGRREIRRLTAEAGLPVASVCAVRFMREPLSGLRDAIAMAAEIGARRVLVPLLEEAHIHTADREERSVAGLAACLDVAERSDVTLVLELDLPGDKSAALLRRLDPARVRACYDSGNATALGLDVAVDVVPVIPFLCEIHVKDRRRGGPSVSLGSGDANFGGFFTALRRGAWQGDFVLEHFFEADPIGEGRGALAFVRQHLRDAGY